MILSAEKIRAMQKAPHQFEEWTVIIPAAGAGTRLAWSRPKALYPILGRPMIARMIDIFEPCCKFFVFVFSPSGALEIEPLVRELLPAERFRVVIQEEPKGMADAIAVCESAVSTPYVCVSWVDQVGLQSHTVTESLALHELRPNAKLTLPTVERQNPYIHLVRDQAGRIVQVLQAREKEITADHGENDCGFFAFTSRDLFSILARANDTRGKEEKQSREFSLLPLFPDFEGEEGAVLTLRNVLQEECLGVNTREEAEVAERMLARRKRTFA